MRKLIKQLVLGLSLGLSLGIGVFSNAAEAKFTNYKAPINVKDKESLQKGAEAFMHYCQGCHSIEFQRFNTTARDIGLSEKLTKENLILTGSYSSHDGEFKPSKFGDLIYTAMKRSDGKVWFGTAPPDLSTIVRARGADYIYTYLRTFYLDPSRPYGVNNIAFPLVGMPHVLLELQGPQVAVYAQNLPKGCSAEDDENCKMLQTITELKATGEGKLNADEYNAMAGDLTNFLSYVAEPAQIQRAKYGPWVLFFLFIFMIFAYLLNREYWKDVH
ncbi:cytochrome c [Gammaproteobacteria bacterium]|nr:cytochrome c [Gammaproteobacteria bacterium]